MDVPSPVDQLEPHAQKTLTLDTRGHNLRQLWPRSSENEGNQESYSVHKTTWT